MPELQLPRGFSCNLPTVEHAIVIFDTWTSALPLPAHTGGSLFSPEDDPRPSYVRDVFGSLEHFEILELGPLEGGHTYQLERLGAKSITAIESNTESFIKCLVIKNAFELKAKLLLGDFIKYLEVIEFKYDLIFASGVLYHMIDPLHLLYLIAKRTDRVFIWTHYVASENDHVFSENLGTPPSSMTGDEPYIDVNLYGFKCRYYKAYYDPNHDSRRYSGLEAYGCHLLKDDIIGALK